MNANELTDWPHTQCYTMAIYYARPNGKITTGQSISNNYGMCLKWKQNINIFNTSVHHCDRAQELAFTFASFYDAIFE